LEELQKLGVDTVIISGYCAEYCILSTCRGAQDLDLTPILLRDALASGIPENIKFVESIDNVISYGALKKVLE
jgi:nicotinamidase-related amidase